MRKIVTAGALTATGLILLMSYPTSTGQDEASTASLGGSTGSSGGASGTGATTAPAPTTGPSGTYTGSSVATRWGNVQVEITVQNGELVDATAIDYPHGNRNDQQINAYAIPRLESATVDAGSADIHAISGATVTSQGYIRSLQSALDQAGL
ncbi:FMN-binding protein [Georgenia muralis]